MAVYLASLRNKLKPASFCKIKSVQSKKQPTRVTEWKQETRRQQPPSPELFCSVSNVPPERVSNMWLVKTGVCMRECVDKGTPAAETNIQPAIENVDDLQDKGLGDI
jgi:hypothetical protein